MKVFSLIKQEIHTLLISPSTYIAAVISLSIMGFFYIFTLYSISISEQSQQPATLFFSTFWIPALLIVPMLTMRSLAEERKQGTLQSLLTTPIRPYQVVFAKFLGAYFFYVAVWICSFLYPLIASYILQQPELSNRLLDLGSNLGGMLFVCLSGTLLVAIGIFSSSLTRSQLVAGMLSFSIIFMLIVGIVALGQVEFDFDSSDLVNLNLISYIQIFDHFEDFSRGIVDTRPITYYLSGTALILGLSVVMVEAKT